MTNSPIGVSGFRRNATAAAVQGGRLAAVCEEGRLIRVRNAGIARTGFPDSAVRAVRRIAGQNGEAVYVTAEEGVVPMAPAVQTHFDHHQAHAATAFLTSGWDRALVLVADSTRPEVSAWQGIAGRLRAIEMDWNGPGFAHLYARLTDLLGFKAGQDEREVEALARVGVEASILRRPGIRYAENRLEVSPDFDSVIGGARTLAERAALAACVQTDLIDAIIALLDDLHRVTGESRLCLGGGLFYNTAVNTAVRCRRIFQDVFVPIDPGNAGLAVGCALSASSEVQTERASPFLGPSFDDDAIKGVLDNCKLQYHYCADGTIIDRAVDTLERGGLVGWFEGRLEWGARALGHRSILAGPLCPFALENLNTFLKQRPSYWNYGVAVPKESAECFFEDASPAPFMECEFLPRDERLLASGQGVQRRLRVQTVAEDAGRFYGLLQACGHATGVPVLINTSFNGFHEPIVCSPRDAVRVFYGTGLDMLVLGSFVIRK